ncbi:MAG: family 43 glycosylhydrolase [Verrucomicrobiales bacterium]|nr:family 43 glycosylhydrolase [Verrucomicrobiales bacterium]
MLLASPECRRGLLQVLRFGTLAALAAASICIAADTRPAGAPAPKPLYRDPTFDGAADPVVLWNPHLKRWWMFYTNRRANAPGLSGVAWVHGTRIGIAESVDAGVTWRHVGECDIPLPADLGGKEPTHWAPEILTAPDGTHHMWLTVVPGVFENWEHPRTLVHFTSKDLRRWSNPQPLQLSSDRVIDACVIRLHDGSWRLWYNNERDRKSIYFADSTDLQHWTDRGKAVGDQEGEGPKVFRWKNAYWMITDVWQGLAVYRSTDALSWKRQPGPNLLQEPGRGPDDGVKGGHPDVVIADSRAYLFYFTHPGRTPEHAKADGTEQRRSSIQVVELRESDGLLSCDRDAPTHIALPVSVP